MSDIDIYLNDTSCCGIKDLDGIQGPDDEDVPTARQIVEFIQVSNRSFAFVIFSQAQFRDAPASVNKAGSRLRSYIHKHNLGVVRSLPAKKNPNSGNKVTPFIWSVDWEALKKHKVK